MRAIVLLFATLVAILFFPACGDDEQQLKEDSTSRAGVTASPTQRPTSAPTATSSKAPTAAPTPERGTRENPAPIGTVLIIGQEWELNVVGVTPDATNLVLGENQFNDPPALGEQFFIATIQAKYVGTASDTFDATFSLRAVGPAGVSYSTFEDSCGVYPDKFPGSTELFPGGAVQGNICWAIRSEDAGALVMYYDPIFGNATDRLYLALY